MGRSRIRDECHSPREIKLNTIGLERNGDWLRLSVEDNGTGFESVKKESSTGGIGLESMQQRVESSGGIFCIRSILEKGTIVKAEWRFG